MTLAIVMRSAHRHPGPGDLPRLLPRTPWVALSGALGLALWLYWSTLVARMPAIGFRFTPNQLYWLAALPLLSMACVRIVGALLPPVVAGSEWTAWASACLLPLAVGVGTLSQLPSTPYEVMILLTLLCGTGAALFVDSIAPKGAGLAEQAGVLRRKSTWLLGWLLLGSFGTVIGLAAAFPLLAASQAPEAIPFAWAGPLAAALLQPAGAHAAERTGAARITLGCFAAMAVAAAGLWFGLPRGPFIACSALLFAAAGAGSGSTLRMIPLVVPQQRERAAAVLGFTVAMAAFGGFILPKALGTSIALTGTPSAALAAFVAFYLACSLVTWWYFGRRFAPMPC